jgi:rhodanese-related sulfurtransferase
VSTEQIVLYALIALLVLLTIRRTLRMRALPRATAAEVAARLRENPKPLLLDVRTAGERSVSTIPGSVHIPLHELGGRMDELKKHRDREIVVFCATGSRSASAALRLKKAGYSVSNLEGGMAEWKLHGRS